MPRRTDFRGVIWAAVFTGVSSGAFAAENPAQEEVMAAITGQPSGLGVETCSTSGCHGGAAEKSNQAIVWSQRDVHSRSFATLTTARAARMAEALKLESPVTSVRCTVCHAPIGAVDPLARLADAHANEGVGCASCHGPADGWLRSHTRPDYTHADRVAAGLRDLHDLYARANTCVACHQNLDPDLVRTGHHPELVFELDGQTQSEPRHWRDAPGAGPQAWLVGQAVAWRELSWALREGRADAAREIPRWEGLRWLLERSAPEPGSAMTSAASAEAFAGAVNAADALAQKTAATWAPENARAILGRLAGTPADFLQKDVSPLVQACRAERLVLAFDRLLPALPATERTVAASRQLDVLFHLAQSKPGFVPAEFSKELAIFAQTLSL